MVADEGGKGTKGKGKGRGKAKGKDNGEAAPAGAPSGTGDAAMLDAARTEEKP